MRQQQKIMWSVLACGLVIIHFAEARGPGGGGGGGGARTGNAGVAGQVAGRNSSGAALSTKGPLPTGFNSARSLPDGAHRQNLVQQQRPFSNGNDTQAWQSSGFPGGPQRTNFPPAANKHASPKPPGERFDKLENVADHRENIHDRHENKRDRWEDYRDRLENRRDHLEDIWDAQHDTGKRDNIEDKYDKQEDKFDHVEDVIDRQENKRDHREDRRDYWEKYRDARR